MLLIIFLLTSCLGNSESAFNTTNTTTAIENNNFKQYFILLVFMYLLNCYDNFSVRSLIYPICLFLYFVEPNTFSSITIFPITIWKYHKFIVTIVLFLETYSHFINMLIYHPVIALCVYLCSKIFGYSFETLFLELVFNPLIFPINIYYINKSVVRKYLKNV